MFSAPTSDVMQGWVMAMMSLKFESEQRRESTTNDVPCRNVIYEPLDIGTLGTDAIIYCRFNQNLSRHQNYIILALVGTNSNPNKNLTLASGGSLMQT